MAKGARPDNNEQRNPADKEREDRRFIQELKRHRGMEAGLSREAAASRARFFNMDPADGPTEDEFILQRRERRRHGRYHAGGGEDNRVP